MECISPLIKGELNEVYLNKKGGLSYRAIFLDRDKYDKGEYENSIGVGNKFKAVYPIACQQCIPCRLNYSRDRANQMMLETQCWKEEESWFCTFTYDDEHVPSKKTKLCYKNWDEYAIRETLTLNHKNAQKFFYKLTKKYPRNKKVYCGEYGSKTERPHGHAIIWGAALDQSQFYDKQLNEWGDPTWRSKELEKLWGKGMVRVGRVTWETCGYVARYTLKKSLGQYKQNYELYNKIKGREPEYITWSNGVGREYLETNAYDIYRRDNIPIANKKTGQLVKPPKSYDRILEQVDPELHESIKQKRLKQAKYYQQHQKLTDNFSPEERRAISEARMQQIMQDFRNKEI